MRSRTILFSLVAAWVLLAATPFAAADIVQDLTVRIDFLTCNNTLCMFDEGWGGGSASGYASFTQLALPWSYAFVTPSASWWCTNCPWWYDAQFDQGGTFTMTGPHGLTFNGIVSAGWTTHYGPGHDEIWLAFSGQWSNGLTAFGDVDEDWWSDPYFDVAAQLDATTIVPDPGSLMLLGSGVLGLAGVLRRKLIR